MTATRIHLESWRFAWSRFHKKLVPRCGFLNCTHARSAWRRIRARRQVRVLLLGASYCVPECLERALIEALRRTKSSAGRSLPVRHRVPLGLLLLSREQLTKQQLQAGLEAQRAAGHGRIGEWLQHLGFVTEFQVTAALARQWSCPVIRNELVVLKSSGVPQVPLLLLEAFHMIPVNYVEATATLHIAFGEGLDYGALYAIEQILGCHTEPCLAAATVVQKNLCALAEHPQRTEMVFERVADAAEFARIVRGYAAKVTATALRMALCGHYIWVRLECPPHRPLDLVLQSPADAAGVLLPSPTLSVPVF